MRKIKTIEQLKKELEEIQYKKAKGDYRDELKRKILLAKHGRKIALAKKIGDVAKSTGRGFGILGKGAGKILLNVGDNINRNQQQQRGKGKRRSRQKPQFF